MTFPVMMQAVAISRTGDIDVLEKQTVPFPKQQPNHVAVKVNYGGVNSIDTHFRKDLYSVRAFPFLVGNKCSGTVVVLPSDPDSHQDRRRVGTGR